VPVQRIVENRPRYKGRAQYGDGIPGIILAELAEQALNFFFVFAVDKVIVSAQRAVLRQGIIIIRVETVGRG